MGNSIIITVTDDEVGFDITKPKNDGRTHIGIDNVKKWLEAQCGDSLLMENESGTSTTAKIILPVREEFEYENHSGRR